MDQNNLKKFGKNIKIIRNKRGWTQQRLAEAAKIHPVYVSYIEKGSRNPSVTNIFRLIRALDCKPTEAFRGII
jgi:transcriptional regulator with XRE-family HTH domain